ncbi:MAG: hypothetical protein GY696_29195, partial [Gammaproteobacteria bacterium]|nr:hypothetical protein [Gammaproteobacteria bacterium]
IGSMAASFMAAMPMWLNFDPLPILAAKKKKKEKEKQPNDTNTEHVLEKLLLTKTKLN